MGYNISCNVTKINIKMLQSTRKVKIVDYLKKENECSINELCGLFDVSFSTIHRDLNELEREGAIRKIYGGVKLLTEDRLEPQSSVRLKINMKQKKRIGQKALQYVKSGDCIFIDNSSTCYYFAESLSGSEIKGVVVITDSNMVPGLFLSKQDITVISTGGTLLRELDSFYGPVALDAISRFNGDKFFFSAGAISLEGQLSDFPANDSIIKKEQFRRCRSRICLVDSSKFNRVRPNRLFDLSQVDTVITDSSLRQENRKEFERAGIRLVIT